MDRKIIFWDVEGEERLTHTEKDTAIESALDGTDKLPETLEICGFVKMALPSTERVATDALERVLECLDEEYADPDGNSTEPTQEMCAAAEVFAAHVLDGYVSWACEVKTRETIDVKAWVKENRPDWLED